MIGDALVVVVALIHAYIVVLEMALWNTPRGRRTFGTTPEFATASKTLAANQGLYNGFLAAGLIWSLFPTLGGGEGAKLFFLGCVAIAGIFGALTVSPRIALVQTAPAALGLLAVLLLP